MTAESPEITNSFSVWQEDGHYIISESGGPTTQGESLVEALLMMADVKRDDEDDAQTMMKMAADVFIMDPEMESFINEELEQDT